MIHDSFSCVERYGIPRADEIIAFLANHDPFLIYDEEIEILGRELFVRRGDYMTRPAQGGKFETHEVYADLQYMVSGAEIMQTAPADALLFAAGYDPAKDISFFTADRDISDILVRAGEFAVFFPGEAHRPMCQRGLGPEAVKKLVFKIRMK